jgi:lysozyme
MNNVQTALNLAASLIDPAEGFAAVAFLDKLAKPPVWTIGHGTTHINDHPVAPGMRCTRAEADAWAAADMVTAVHQVLGCVRVPLSDPQLAALTSLCYNLGIGNLRASTVLAALNQGLYRPAADRFLEYDHAGGVEIGGLATRRARERALFLSTLPAAPLSEADALNDAEIGRLAGQPERSQS